MEFGPPHSFTRAVSEIHEKDLDRGILRPDFYEDMEKRLSGFLDNEMIKRVDIEDYLAKDHVCRSV